MIHTVSEEHWLDLRVMERRREYAAQLTPEDRMPTFPVGHTQLVERKLDGPKPNPVSVTVGTYTPVGRIFIPKGKYTLTHQIRLDAGYWAKVRFVRIGWGKDPDGRDETGLHPYRPCPDGQAFSDSHTHPLSGGGPVECQVKVYGPVMNGTKVTLPTSIFKAIRLQ